MKNLKINAHHEKLAFEFNLSLKAKGYNSGKENYYHILVREFLFFLESIQVDDVRLCRSGEIKKFYNYLFARRKQRGGGQISFAYQRQFIFSIGLFFDHLLEIDEIENHPVYFPRFFWGKANDREILNTNEIELLYKTCSCFLERAILSLAYGCGLRRSEIFNLRTQDILISKSVIVIRNGKNHKNRTIPTTEKINGDLYSYLKNERSLIAVKENQFVSSFFLRESGSPMSGGDIYVTVKRIIKRTNNQFLIRKKISLHHLRHSITVHMLNKGADIDFVRRFLGHASIDTTTIYARRRKQKLALHRRVLSANRHFKSTSHETQF